MAAVVLLLFVLQLFVGSVPVPLMAVVHAIIDPARVDDGTLTIVREIRLPQAITALLAGCGLAVSGLLMQTLFRNPLAGPSVLGISSGASLGVAIVMLAQPLWSGFRVPSDAVLVIAALFGAVAVLVLVLLADRRIGDGVTLLIVGMLIGYLCSAIISILQAASGADALKGYVLWGMGTFAGVSNARMLWLMVPVLIGIGCSLAYMKVLNALLMGEDLAATMGVNVRRSRRRLMWVTGILAGTITAFCGPIAFIGLITPHLARGLLRTSDHSRLLPGTLLCGGALALFCDWVSRTAMLGSMIPLNAITSMLGVPVVAWVLFSGKRWTRRT